MSNHTMRIILNPRAQFRPEGIEVDGDVHILYEPTMVGFRRGTLQAGHRPLRDLTELRNTGMTLPNWITLTDIHGVTHTFRSEDLVRLAISPQED